MAWKHPARMQAALYWNRERRRERLSSEPPPWTPADISPFAWYDPSDLSTLWQDAAGTIPVTADGQTVARMDDKSGNGYHAVQATEASRPVYHTDGTLHWLRGDGSNDFMDLTGMTATKLAMAAAVSVGASTGFRGIVCSASGGGSMMLASQSPSNRWGTYGSSGYPAGTALQGAGPTVVVMEGLSSGTFYTNGIADGTYAGTQGQGTGYLWGAGGQNVLANIYGVVLSDALFDDGLAELTTYLGSKAGLTL